MSAAYCRGANATTFFPSDGSGVEAVQRVCAQCPVRGECLEYALTNRLDYGVWGGASERERQRILRQRRRLPHQSETYPVRGFARPETGSGGSRPTPSPRWQASTE
ncbi:MAG: WhiB family transcriptional regulator [Acidimicrobiia bacterium]